MHFPPLIADLATILATAGLVTLLFQRIKQPLVLGYIVAGFIVGPYTSIPLTVTDFPNVKVLAELGVIFLMFSLGLEFTFHKLVSVGSSAASTAVIEGILMLALGYGTGSWLGWAPLDSLFLGAILSVSSTTIIIKAYEELGLKTRRFAELVFGILIVEDIFAILLLVSLTTVVQTKVFTVGPLLLSAGKLLLVVGSWFLIGYFVVPKFLRNVRHYLNNETLTVLSAGLCLSLVALAAHFHYSSALGAFIMGSILAETGESHRIEAVVQPIKDLFAAVFFVSVGMLVDPQALLKYWPAILTVTLVTIVGKIGASTFGALLTGQPLKRSVQIGFSLGQIGEFSFIIATLGISLQVTSDFLYPVAVAASVITTFTTPYLIKISGTVADHLERALPPVANRALSNYSRWFNEPGFASAGGRSGMNALQSLVQVLLQKQPTANEKISSNLAPWDLHLTRLKIHQNSELAGQAIKDLQVRTRFGLNIVAIQRGLALIMAPAAGERLMPHDELLVLGTDDQMEIFRQVTETPLGQFATEGDLARLMLRSLHVAPESELVGMALRDSGIRDRLHGLVVGLERQGNRTINPDPATHLQAGDILWVL